MNRKLSIAIGADHRGFALKQKLLAMPIIAERNVTWHDCGADSAERSDYPQFAKIVCERVLSRGESPVVFGILLCGTGNGMAMAANRFRGIYAAVAWNAEIARRAREEDWANVLVLPADYLSTDEAIEILTAWLKAEPKTGRYRERVLGVDKLVIL